MISATTLLLWVSAAALGQAPVSSDATGLAHFESRIRPLLASHCYKCHSAASEKLRGGLLLDSRAGWARGGDSGPAILPGEPAKSLIVKAVRYEDDKLQMPPGGKLSAREIADLVEWVRLGAPDPRDETPPPVAKPRRVIDLEAERKHWAYQPLAADGPPRVKNDSWCRTPVDRFVLAKLEEKGLEPNGPASRQKIIRRASLDVTGLPPTPGEIETFLKDESPDAVARLVDRLLDSPRHGERWARHWLDLARFAESHGFEHDYDRSYAYYYRDFVIRALNADMPYDTFVEWQLAGDEIEPENPLALMATGFLGAGVHSTQITKNQVEKERYDELDDMLAITGTAFLGLTFGCARCHDHKFDPIPTRDYYRMLSTFTTTVRSEMDVDMDPKAYRADLAKWEADHAPLADALARFEKEEIPGRLEAWLRGGAKNESSPDWLVLGVESSKSEGGATFADLGDGSLLAGGKNPDSDTQTFSARARSSRITGIRLEALAHESLVKGGPGRASNGNFALTELRVAATPLDEAGNPKGAPADLKLRAARATFDQKGLGSPGAIDGDKATAWAVDPEFGKDHAIAFDVDFPEGLGSGALLTFTLTFASNTGHGIARPRFSISTATAPAPIQGSSRPERVDRVLAALATGKSAPAAEDIALLEKWFRPRDPDWRKLDAQAAEHLKLKPKPRIEKIMVSSEGVPAIRLHTQGDDFLKDTHFLLRGDPNNKGDVAAQGFLQVLMKSESKESRWLEPPPAGWRTSYRRRSFAHWITDAKEGAGQLLARVIVNRLWQHYFGRGIVSTPSDFGSQGERPTHPELLDWLAQRLIEGGWRLKPIHKLLLTSAAYLETSGADPVKSAADPDDKLFWRHAPRRLEAEAIRDSLLFVSGLLDERMFGPGTLDSNMRRRSVYFTMKRSALIPMLVLFDAPDALQGIGARPTTTIAPQALHLMNSPFARDCAQAFAKRLAALPSDASREQVARAAYGMALGREPGADELSDCLDFIDAQARSYAADGKPDASELALADFCQVMLGLNEVIYVD